MANIFVSSDPHFGHANILTFQNPDGTLMRPFDSVEQMDEYIIECHNSVVRPQDKFYCLGDVAMHRRHIATAKKRNGHGRLVRGNHDDYPTKYYLEVYEEIYGTRKIDEFIFSHIPLHPESVTKLTNVHGHVHSNVPAMHFGPRHINVSMEVIAYTPVALEDLKVMARKQMSKWAESLPDPDYGF